MRLYYVTGEVRRERWWEVGLWAVVGNTKALPWLAHWCSSYPTGKQVNNNIPRVQ